MASQYKNCLVAQSGGPTVAINSSLAGILTSARSSGQIEHIYGAVNGIQGVLEDRILDLDAIFGTDPSALMRLKNSPAMYLGSCRYKLADPETPSGDYTRIFQIFKKYEIGYFLYIGGNDSMDTIYKLSKYGKQTGSDIRFMGVPKTIDNDLPVTDHTPGYGSAARYIAASVLEMAYDTYIYNTKSVLIVEIMGRDAGWLAAASSLARTEYSAAPHLIYLPEHEFSNEQFLRDLQALLSRQNHVVAAVSEGIRYKDGSYVSADSAAIDQFGHALLSGVGKYLEHLVAREIGCKVRSVEINVLQRCASHLSSATDLDESFRLGQMSFDGALSGRTGELPVIRRLSDVPYQITYEYIRLADVANREKPVPAQWINEEGNDVTDDFLCYAAPLIRGTPDVTWQDGLPVFLPVPHLINEHKKNPAPQ